MEAATQGLWTHGVDVHFHLLPGVDDGPATMSDSVELARAAVAEGTGTVVATPHVRHDFVTDVSELPPLVREVQAALDGEGIRLTVRCGGELGHEMVGRLRQSELDAIAHGPPGARWLLVEAPFGRFDEDFHGATDELRDRGFGVLVGHPERSADAATEGGDRLRHELANGSLAQLNAMSLLGRHGEDAEAAAYRMLRHGSAAVVGSDAHGPTRPPALAAVRTRLLGRGVSPELARRLTFTGPRRLLARGIARPGVLAA